MSQLLTIGGKVGKHYLVRSFFLVFMTDEHERKLGVG
jgi:hypothetical protein